TTGRVSDRGVFPITWTFDTAGPLARGVEDAGLVLSVLIGYDPEDPLSIDHPAEDLLASVEAGLDGLRIGVPRNFFFDGLDADDRDHRSAGGGRRDDRHDAQADAADVRLDAVGPPRRLGPVRLRLGRAARRPPARRGAVRGSDARPRRGCVPARDGVAPSRARARDGGRARE